MKPGDTVYAAYWESYRGKVEIESTTVVSAGPKAIKLKDRLGGNGWAIIVTAEMAFSTPAAALAALLAKADREVVANEERLAESIQKRARIAEAVKALAPSTPEKLETPHAK